MQQFSHFEFAWKKTVQSSCYQFDTMKKKSVAYFPYFLKNWSYGKC
jgi:hypothetical protein